MKTILWATLILGTFLAAEAPRVCAQAPPAGGASAAPAGAPAAPQGRKKRVAVFRFRFRHGTDGVGRALRPEH